VRRSWARIEAPPASASRDRTQGSDRIVGLHALEVALHRAGQAAEHQQAEDARARLAGLVRLLALQQVAAAAGVGVQREEGASLRLKASTIASRTTCFSTSAWLPAWKAWR
jgi:hypothetical protein